MSVLGLAEALQILGGRRDPIDAVVVQKPVAKPTKVIIKEPEPASPVPEKTEPSDEQEQMQEENPSRYGCPIRGRSSKLRRTQEEFYSKRVAAAQKLYGPKFNAAGVLLHLTDDRVVKAFVRCLSFPSIRGRMSFEQQAAMAENLAQTEKTSGLRLDFQTVSSYFAYVGQDASRAQKQGIASESVQDRRCNAAHYLTAGTIMSIPSSRVQASKRVRSFPIRAAACRVSRELGPPSKAMHLSGQGLVETGRSPIAAA
jgi:hypothetical protein